MDMTLVGLLIHKQFSCFVSFSFFWGVSRIKKVAMSDKTNSACWKRAKRLDVNKILHQSFYQQTLVFSVIHCLIMNTQESSFCADERDLEDLLSQSSQSQNQNQNQNSFICSTNGDISVSQQLKDKNKTMNINNSQK